MKKILTLTLAMLATTVVTAQTVVYTGAPDDIPDNDIGNPLCTSVMMPGSATVSSANLLGIDLAIDHTWIDDLVITLESPSATVVSVFNSSSGSSTNLLNTFPITFTDTAMALASDFGESPSNCGTDEVQGDPAAPCTDTQFLPEAPFAGFNGDAAGGTWTLCVGDGANGDTGQLFSWTIRGNGALPVELQSFSID